MFVDPSKMSQQITNINIVVGKEQQISGVQNYFDVAL